MAEKNVKKLKGRLMAVELKKELADEKIKIARNICYGVGGLTILMGLFALVTQGPTGIFTLITSVVFGGIIIGLGFLTNDKPIMATIISAVLITLLYGIDVLVAMAQGSSSGIVIKLAICFSLYLGVYNAFVARNAMKEYNTKKAEIDQLIQEQES